MSNKNRNNFCITSCPEGFVEIDIMVCKANVLTYIWSFLTIWKIPENRFDDEKIAFWQKICQIRLKIIFTLFFV